MFGGRVFNPAWDLSGCVSTVGSDFVAWVSFSMMPMLLGRLRVDLSGREYEAQCQGLQRVESEARLGGRNGKLQQRNSGGGGRRPGDTTLCMF